MTTENFVLEARGRSLTGSRAARRLRSQGLVPGNIYGHNEENVLVCVDAKEFRRFFEAGHRVLTLRVQDEKGAATTEEHNVVKAVQYDSFGLDILHVDFTRVSADEKIDMEVPVETVGIPKGVANGGLLDMPLKQVLVRGRASDLPERLEIVAEDFEIGHAVRIKDLKVPEGCEFVQDSELMVLHVSPPRGSEEPQPEAEGPNHPEVIGRKKPEEGEGAE